MAKWTLIIVFPNINVKGTYNICEEDKSRVEYVSLGLLDPLCVDGVWYIIMLYGEAILY